MKFPGLESVKRIPISMIGRKTFIKYTYTSKYMNTINKG